jgi:hypothetical protein
MGNLPQRFRLFALVAASAILLLVPLKTFPQTSRTPAITDLDEYAVYSDLLNALFSSSKAQQFVINSETSSKSKGAFVGLIGGFVRTGASRPQTESDTKTDFDQKNDKSNLLERHFELNIPYVLLSSNDLRAIFVPDGDDHHLDMDAWKRFYGEYPGAAGVLALSRVGFNSKKNQALVYVQIQHNLLGGKAWFVLLSKTEKNWKIGQQVLMWMS